MASLRRIPRSPYWIACFTLPDGRRTQRSTGSSNRSKAQKVANELEDASREAREGRLTETRARKAIADIYAMANRSNLPTSKIGEFFDSWLARKTLEVEGSTSLRYTSVKKALLEHLGDRVQLDLSHLTARDITSFRDILAERVAPTTVNISLKIVRSALQQAKRDGIIDSNVAERVSQLKHSGGFERRPFTIAEIKKVLAVADGEWRSLILFALYTGQRLADVASLRWSNLDLMRGTISLQTGKTGRRQLIPMAKPLFKHVQTRSAGSDPKAFLFPGAAAALKDGGASGTLSNRFYDILVAAGLAKLRTHKKTGNGRSARRSLNALSFHSLRHTTTSLLKNAGTNDSVARDIVGHDSAAVSANYTHIDEKTKRKALNTLPNLS